MAPIIRLAATLAAVAGLALGETIDWKQVESAGPATGFEVAPQADPVPNYTAPVSLSDSSIRAPLDCKNQDTYLGQQYWTDGPLSIKRCADACSAQRQWDPKKPCRFFNTYTLLKVTKGDPTKGTPSVSAPAGQVCSLYTESWPASYATDKGQWRGDTLYVITDSWTASNSADPGSGECPKSTATTAKPTTTLAPTPTLTTKTVTTTTTTSKAY
ncbi:hypothetical protein PG984_005183 [Apiospora sp. TS-2023a]